jgi:hypothetical protein
MPDIGLNIVTSGCPEILESSITPSPRLASLDSSSPLNEEGLEGEVWRGQFVSD